MKIQLKIQPGDYGSWVIRRKVSFFFGLICYWEPILYQSTKTGSLVDYKERIMTKEEAIDVVNCIKDDKSYINQHNSKAYKLYLQHLEEIFKIDEPQIYL